MISASKLAFASLSFDMDSSFSALLLSRIDIRLFASCSCFSSSSISSLSSFSWKPAPETLRLNPPCMAPDNSVTSPSRVTILSLPTPIFLATSILSTTTVFPNTYENIVWNMGSNLMRLSAIPWTPCSLRTDWTSFSGGAPLILFIGRNVAVPSLLFFRNLMHSAAVLSVSTTMLLILGPAATSRAVLYFDVAMPRSETVPKIPLMWFFCSRIFLTAMSPSAFSFMLICLAFSLASSSPSFMDLALALLICAPRELSSFIFWFSSSVAFLKSALMTFSFSSSAEASFPMAVTLSIFSSAVWI